MEELLDFWHLRLHSGSRRYGLVSIQLHSDPATAIFGVVGLFWATVFWTASAHVANVGEEQFHRDKLLAASDEVGMLPHILFLGWTVGQL